MIKDKNQKNRSNKDKLLKNLLDHKQKNLEDKIATVRAVRQMSSSIFSDAIKSLLKK